MLLKVVQHRLQLFVREFIHFDWDERIEIKESLLTKNNSPDTQTTYMNMKLPLLTAGFSGDKNCL